MQQKLTESIKSTLFVAVSGTSLSGAVLALSAEAETAEKHDIRDRAGKQVVDFLGKSKKHPSDGHFSGTTWALSAHPCLEE